MGKTQKTQKAGIQEEVVEVAEVTSEVVAEEEVVEVATQEVTSEEVVASALETINKTSKPLFSRIKEEKIIKFTNDVQGVQLNTCKTVTKNAIVNFYIARHSIAFTMKARNNSLKNQAITIDTLTERRDKEAVDSVEWFAIQGEIERTEEYVETLKAEFSALLQIEQDIITNAKDIIGDNLYKCYKSCNTQDFTNALKVWFESNGIIPNDTLTDYFRLKFGLRSATNRTMLDSGNSIQHKSKREFESLFLDSIAQLFKEKKVANFVRFEEQLSLKAEKAIEYSRDLLAQKSAEKLERLAEIERMEKYTNIA